MALRRQPRQPADRQEDLLNARCILGVSHELSAFSYQPLTEAVRELYARYPNPIRSIVMTDAMMKRPTAASPKPSSRRFFGPPK